MSFNSICQKPETNPQNFEANSYRMTAVEEKALEFGHIKVDNTFPNFENVMWRYTDKVVNERLQSEYFRSFYILT